METKERIITKEAEAIRFINEQVRKIRKRVGKNKAICFVSGGVDSSVVAVLGQGALGDKNFLPVIIENGLMRKDEIRNVRQGFYVERGIFLELIEASELFFDKLKGQLLPYDKRTAIRRAFYGGVLPEIVKKSGAEFFLQGTILTDIEATAQNSEAPQHNVLKQIGLKIGRLEIIEPLAELRKPSVRLIAKVLGLPEDVCNRMPFPGPALAARIIGEVTREKVEIIRKITAIVEKELEGIGAFQYFAVLTSDMAPNYERTKLGYAITIVCINSINAVTALPTKVSYELITGIRNRIYREIPEVFRVAWDFSTKPPAAIEWV